MPTRYQAEALIYQHVPLDALMGIVCFNQKAEMQLQNALKSHNVSPKLVVRPTWYF
jgi:hypothetical protein